ncbi:hypothetical protein I2I05_08510 [Hymenobacter sp. BT683]|uniref:Uncharacterized protein n=1 Tax=Hymenobacter jeongseonensis TaxID=2791027 RepID=A0ABS0IGE4_9BACT|nr:hypothetical protein [Hymenobacter jeongseonensis]MBF9237438.1 hypothetical protein [Hymenobacter jeongseonensis]
MKDTKLTLSNKTVKVDLPDATGTNLKSVVVDSSGFLGIGFSGGGGGDNTPFNGQRPIVAAIPYLQGKTLGGTTTGAVLENFLKVLYPAQAPVATLSVANPNREVGESTAVTLTYGVAVKDNPIDSIVVNGGQRDPDVLTGVVTTATAVDTNTTFTMSATDSAGLTDSESVTVQYFRNRFWFRAAANLLTSSASEVSEILNSITSKEFSTSRAQTRSFTLDAEYIYFAYPVSFGTASFVVGGLPNTAYQFKDFAYVNTFGNSTLYRLYRSGNAGTGTITVEVK